MPLPRVEILPVGGKWEVRRDGAKVAESLTPVGAVTLAEGVLADAANEVIAFAYGSFLALRDRVVRLIGPIAAHVTPEDVEKGEAATTVKIPLLDSVISETNRSGPWTRAIGRVVFTGATVSGSCCPAHGELREAVDSFLALDRSEVARTRRAEFLASIAEEERACQAPCDTPTATNETPPTENPS